jgi:hypothetical protein
LNSQFVDAILLAGVSPTTEQYGSPPRGGQQVRMTDILAARANAHRANIKRYCGLLAMDLTESERAYLHKRIAEEQAALEELMGTSSTRVERNGPPSTATGRAGHPVPEPRADRGGNEEMPRTR